MPLPLGGTDSQASVGSPRARLKVPRLSGLAMMSFAAGVIQCGLVAWATASGIERNMTGGPVSPLAWGVFLVVTIGTGDLLMPLTVSAVVTIVTGHGARVVIRGGRKAGYAIATTGLTLGYSSLALVLVSVLATWILVTFTKFGQ